MDCLAEDTEPTQDGQSNRENTSGQLFWKDAATATRSSRNENPQNIEDVAKVDSNLGIICVCDGMLEQGQRAAWIAAKHIVDMGYHCRNAPNLTRDTITNIAQWMWQVAERSIEEIAQTGDTTATAVLFYEENGVRYAAIVHTGDSRAYVVKRDGAIVQLTTDENNVLQFFRMQPEALTFINTVLDSAQGRHDVEARQEEYARDIAPILQRRYEELRPDPNGDTGPLDTLDEFRRLQNALDECGVDSFDKIKLTWFWGRRHETYGIHEDPQIIFYALEKDDVAVILTTDGVHDNLSNSEIQAIISSHISQEAFSQSLAQALIDAAYKESVAGALGMTRSKPDDITAVVVQL